MLEVAPFEDGQAKAWDAFVQNSTNGTIFNLRRFLSYHPPGRFRDASFSVLRRGNVMSVVPGVLVGDRWISHGGSSYGGFILGEKIAFDLCRDIVEASVAYVRSLGAKSFTVTMPPNMYRKVPHDYLEANLLYQGFRYAKREITNACGRIHEGFLEDWVNKARGAVRRAQAEGLEIHNPKRPTPEEMASFYRILKTNRDALGASVTHSPEDLDRLFSLLPESLDLYLARHEGVDVGCGLVFRCNPQVDLIFYVAHLEEHRHLKPIHMLVHRMYEEAAKRSVPWVDYGTSTLNGKLTNEGLLLAFKENFNMLGYFRDTFILDL